MKQVLERIDAEPRLARRIAAAVCVAVAVARVVLALATPAPDLTPDGVGYDDAARRIIRDGYYAWVYAGDVVDRPAPNAMQLPGYPYFLAGVYGLAGGASVAAQPLVSVVQAVLSALTLWGVFLLASRLGGSRAGVLAALLGAAYVPLWFSYRYVLTEDLFAALCVWTAVCALTGLDATGRGRVGAFALSGLLAAAATYVRAASALWLVSVGVLLILCDRAGRRQHLRDAAVVSLVLAACMAPWWIRSAGIYGTFVPFNTLASTGALVAAHDDPEGLAADLASLHHGHLEPSEELAYNRQIAALARDRTREALAADGLSEVWRRARQLAISLFTYHPNPWNGFTGWGALVEAVHLGVLALAARGAWRFRHSAGMVVLLALPLALVGLHAATLAFSRYFLPMMPIVTAIAALGAVPAPRR